MRIGTPSHDWQFALLVLLLMLILLVFLSG